CGPCRPKVVRHIDSVAHAGGDPLGIGLASGVGIVRHADDRLGHRLPRVRWSALPAVMRLAASRRPLDVAVAENQDLARIGPIDDAVAAIAILDMMPEGSDLQGRPIVLQTGEDDAWIRRMLSDEVAAQAGEAVVLGRELAGSAWIAIEKDATV